MEDTNKKNIEAVVNANEVFTRDFFADNGRRGGKSTASKLTPQKRKKLGKMLTEARLRAAKARKKARRLDDSLSTGTLAE